MSGVPATTGVFLPSKLDRQVGRALAGIEASNLVGMRRDVARIERMTGTAEAGMQAVARVGLMEAAVAQAAPHVMPELQMVRRAAALGIAGVVFDAGRGA
ncbi:MAG TPA: hypothetical protein VK721_13845 [Solirubrobacteraceae bacterium]|jgi:hypothetical protein|nr:hypothetical protein [Solirubrobacteraceae bacterium]